MGRWIFLWIVWIAFIPAEVSADCDWPDDLPPLSETLQQHRKWVESLLPEEAFSAPKGWRMDHWNDSAAELLKAALSSPDSVQSDGERMSLGDYEGEFYSLRCDFEFSDLRGAGLDGVWLPEARFTDALLIATVLSNSRLMDAKFSGADMRGADLSGADLAGADLSFANLTGTDLRGSILSGANLESANLTKADLTNTDLSFANLTDAEIGRARFDEWSFVQGTIFDNVNLAETHHEDLSLLGAAGLSRIRIDSPSRAASLRQKARDQGLRTEERALTSALRKHSLGLGYREVVTDHVTLVLEEWVLGGRASDFGADPLRPLAILVWLLFPFSGLYLLSILDSTDRTAGIWRVWPDDRVDRTRGSGGPERVTEATYRASLWACWFSLLSAFHFGWREFSLGNWLMRASPYEYSIRATGWVRVVAGIQSLISLYLLVLAFVTYFGRPFG